MAGDGEIQLIRGGREWEDGKEGLRWGGFVTN